MITDFRKALKNTCKLYGDKVAITYMRDDNTTTYTLYKEIITGCEKIKQMLEQAGVVSGDRVAIVSPHSPQAVLAALGLAYANITAVLIDATLPTTEINRLLKFADVRSIFVTEKIFSYLDKQIKEGIPLFQLCERENEYILFEESSTCVSREKTYDPERDVIAILFSSGTTAQMKGIKVTYESVLKASKIFVRNVAWKAEYKYLHVFPLNHIAGYATMHAFLSCGSELGMIEEMTAIKLQGALVSYEPHGFGMIPKVFEMMEDKIREEIKKKGKIIEYVLGFLLCFSGFLRKNFGINIGRIMFGFMIKRVFGNNITTIGTGASICRKSTSKLFIDMGLNWANFYALTETNVPAVSTGIYDRYPVLMAGNITRNPEIKIVIHSPNEEGVGEIYVKSELLMKGYFRDEKLTQESFDGEYFKTGDYGYIDKKNNLFVTGRVKEAILLHNGKKVSPSDVENYYKKQISQIDIACCGCLKEDCNYDEIYMFVQTSGKKVDEIEEAVLKLRSESENANNLYKIDHIQLIDTIPLTSVGKVKRFELKNYAIKGKRYSDTISPKEWSNDIKEQILYLVKKVMEKEIDIGADTKFREELGFDSLMIYELSTQVELYFDINISGDWNNIYTINDLAIYIEQKKLSSKAKKEERRIYPIERTNKDIRKIKQLVRILNSICKVQYEGIENLTDTPCIYASNHSSHLDTICIYKAIVESFGYAKVYDMCCLAAKELVKEGKMDKIFRSVGAIPVDRNGNAVESLIMLNKCIKEKGYSAIIFPEGTRTRSGKIGTFMNGVATAAIETDTPIIPVAIIGTFHIWPASRRRPKFSLKRKIVKVLFGKPIYPMNSDVSELTKTIELKVKELYKGDC